MRILQEFFMKKYSLFQKIPLILRLILKLSQVKNLTTDFVYENIDFSMKSGKARYWYISMRRTVEEVSTSKTTKKHFLKKKCFLKCSMVGNARLELTTPRSQSVCASQLRQFPEKWWVYQELNLGPHDYQSCALTNWAIHPYKKE